MGELAFLCASSKILQIISARESVEKKESSYIIVGNVFWCSHCGEPYGGSLKKL